MLKSPGSEILTALNKYFFFFPQSKLSLSVSAVLLRVDLKPPLVFGALDSPLAATPAGDGSPRGFGRPGPSSWMRSTLQPELRYVLGVPLISRLTALLSLPFTATLSQSRHFKPTLMSFLTVLGLWSWFPEVLRMRLTVFCSCLTVGHAYAFSVTRW